MEILLEVLGLWIGTFAVSLGLEVKQHFRIIRDMADRGYKTDLDQFSDLKGVSGLDDSKFLFTSLFFPVINLLKVAERRIKYYFMKDQIFEELKESKIISKMTDEEQQEYRRKPTAMNAFHISIENHRVTCTIKISSKDGVSEILFQSNGVFEEVQILEVKGPISNLPLSKQQEKLKEALQSILRAGIQKYGEPEHFMEAARNHSYMDLRKDTSQRAQIEELQAMKSELIGQPEVEQPKQKVKGDQK